MILSELRRYLEVHQRASLIDLAHHFDIEADALRGMLAKLITKGRVEQLPMEVSSCSGCCKCDSASVEIYQWKA